MEFEYFQKKWWFCCVESALLMHFPGFLPHLFWPGFEIFPPVPRGSWLLVPPTSVVMEGTTWTPCSAPEVALYPRSQQLDPKTGDAVGDAGVSRFLRCFVSTSEVCFSGSVLMETFDIEVVSFDGNSKFWKCELSWGKVGWTWSITTFSRIFPQRPDRSANWWADLPNSKQKWKSSAKSRKYAINLLPGNWDPKVCGRYNDGFATSFPVDQTFPVPYAP